jgi:hypothetical protein
MKRIRNTDSSDFNVELKLKDFKVYKIDSEATGGHTYGRKDFYKINITTGKFVFHYADKSIAHIRLICFFRIHICLIHAGLFRQNSRAIPFCLTKTS